MRTAVAAGLALAALAIGSPAASATKWLCKPGLKNNACRVGLRTTVYSPSGKKLRSVRRRYGSGPFSRPATSSVGAWLPRGT